MSIRLGARGRQAPRRADAECGQLPQHQAWPGAQRILPELCPSRAFGAAERTAKAEFACGCGSGGRAPAVSVPDSPPRMSLPTRPVSSAKAGPVHAPIRSCTGSTASTAARTSRWMRHACGASSEESSARSCGRGRCCTGLHRRRIAARGGPGNARRQVRSSSPSSAQSRYRHRITQMRGQELISGFCRPGCLGVPAGPLRQ